MSSIKNTTKLDLMNDMQIFVCSVNNRIRSENIKQNFERVMSYNENLIHAGLGSLSPKEIMQISSLSSHDLKGQLSYMQFAKDFPHPDWYDKPMSHDDACKRLAQIDNHFDKENGEVFNEKTVDAQRKPEFKDIYKQARTLSHGQDTEIKSNDPLNKAKHLARVDDSLDSISLKLNERSADQLKGVMNEKIRGDADIQNRMDVISTWNKAQDKESLSVAQEMKKNFHQGLKDMVGYKNKQEKVLEELYDIMENGYPPMTDKEYRNNIAEKEAEVKAIEDEIKQLDKDTIKEKNALLKEMKTAEPYGEKFNNTLKALQESQKEYEEKMADYNESLTEAKTALEEAKNAPHQEKESLLKAGYVKTTDMAVNAYKQTATVTKATLNVMKDGYTAGKEIVHNANERAKFEGAKAYNGVDRKVANLQIKALQYANDLDKASLNHKKNINNKLTKIANKIANNQTIKNVRKGFRGIKEGFKSLVGRGDMQQYAKDIAAIDQTINHEINFNSKAIADLQQSIAATDLAIENLQTNQMTKAEKFVQENKEYLKEHHLDGIAQDLKDNPNMTSKWIDAQKDIVNSDRNTPSQAEVPQKSLNSKVDDLADRDD